MTLNSILNHYFYFLSQNTVRLHHSSPFRVLLVHYQWCSHLHQNPGSGISVSWQYSCKGLFASDFILIYPVIQYITWSKKMSLDLFKILTYRLVFYVFIFDMEITSFLEVIPVPLHYKEEGSKARQGKWEEHTLNMKERNYNGPCLHIQ